MTAQTDPNRLYYGDNLQVLREHLKDASVDLIYLDPPFNSKRDYNLLFKTPKPLAKSSRKNARSASAAAAPEYDYSDAQITAFEDTWHWNEVAEREFSEILKCGNTDVAELMQALRAFLKQNDMLAYLTMMCNRLLELHRVLKPTGSLYLHCDPTASHYLKLVLDGVFGKENYRNEISWQRSSAHSDAKQGMRRYGRIRDTIYWYTKSETYTWHSLYTAYSSAYLASEYRHVDEQGQHYKEADVTAAKPGGDTQYNWHVMRPKSGKHRWTADLDGQYLHPLDGIEYSVARPYVGRIWAYSRENMIEFARQGKLIHRETGAPRLKLYAKEMSGVALQDQWDDISPASGGEYLGYPTQKPLALLERIISASSNEGDVVLDPFCGCGTAVHAAEKLNRRWIGIDITHLSIGLIERRMKEAFVYLQKKGAFAVIGTPQDFGSAEKLARDDKYQFQSWACMMVGAQPYKGGKKGADGGIDGLLWLHVGQDNREKVIVQVKGGLNVGRADIATLVGDVAREKAAIGLFVTLTAPTREMVKEAAAAGHYESPFHGNFPKIQILNIEGLLSGKERAQFPDLSRGEQTFKKPKRENVAAVLKQGRLI